MTKTNVNANIEVKKAKVTKKDAWNTILGFNEIQARPDLVKFIEHEIELLERKNKGGRKVTPQQKKNEEIKEKIFEILDKPMTATEIQKIIEPLFPDITFSNQRMTQLLYQMKKDNIVERTEIKRRAYFEKVVEG